MTAAQLNRQQGSIDVGLAVPWYTRLLNRLRSVFDVEVLP